LFRKKLWSFQSIHSELAKLYSKKVIFRMVCPANLWAGTEMVNPDRTQRQTGHSLLQFGGDSMSTELATNWTPAEKIPPAKPHALALFPVNDTERAEQFVKLFADELRLRARTETLVVVGNRLWRTVYLSKLPGLDKKIRIAFDWTKNFSSQITFVRYMTSSTTVAISVGRAEAKTRPGIETATNPPRLRLIELLGGVRIER
jgi:hypothetical protein